MRHSGAATSHALNGTPDFWIRELGGWGKKSDAYLTYLRLTPWEERAAMTVYLTQPYLPKAHEVCNYWDQNRRRSEAQSVMEGPARAMAEPAQGAPAARTAGAQPHHKRGHAST